MPKLSIVVPVYNTEKYLDRCVQSIFDQTFSDWEMILVDDGSTDKSSTICDGYAAMDSRVKVAHKANGGLSSARNAGIDNATGEYIGFVDSDDTINKEMYSRMIEIADEHRADCVMADCLRIPKSGNSFLKTCSIRGGYYSKEDIKKDVYPSLIMGSNIDYGPLLSACQCVYRREFLQGNKICFDETIRWSEDNLFSAIMGYYTDSFYYLKGEGLYNYYQNEGSITTSYRKGAWEVYSRMNQYLKEYFEGKSDYDFTQQLKWHMIYYACVCVSQTKSLPKEEATKELKSILSSAQLEEAFQNVDLSGVNPKLKVQLFLMKHKLIAPLRYLINRR